MGNHGALVASHLAPGKRTRVGRLGKQDTPRQASAYHIKSSGTG